MNQSTHTPGTLLLALTLLVVMFLPSFIAGYRRHRNAVPIGLLNLFLGWTVIGWVIALIWSASDNTEWRTPRG
jgi:hypothetical protein